MEKSSVGAYVQAQVHVHIYTYVYILTKCETLKKYHRNLLWNCFRAEFHLLETFYRIFANNYWAT